MKTATIFLAALTVFASLLLETSASPAVLNSQFFGDAVKKVGSVTAELVGDAKAAIGDVAGNIEDAIKSLQAKIDSANENSVKVDKKLKKFLSKSVEEINVALTELLEANEEDLAKATGVEKEVLNKILNQLKNFNNIIRVIYTTLKSAVATGNSTLIKIAVFILSKANEKTKADQAEIIQTLNDTPGEIVGSFKTVVREKVDFIVATTEEVIDKLDTFLSTRGLNASV